MKKLYLSLAIIVAPIAMIGKPSNEPSKVFSYDVAAVQAAAVAKAQEAKNALLKANFSAVENSAKAAFFKEEMNALASKLATASDVERAGIQQGLDALKKELEALNSASAGVYNTVSHAYQKLTATVVQYPSAAVATIVALATTVLVLLNNANPADTADDIENF